MAIEELRKKQFMSVDVLASILGISRTYTYQVVAAPECEFIVVKLGRRFIIPTNSFFKWYDSLSN